MIKRPHRGVTFPNAFHHLVKDIFILCQSAGVASRQIDSATYRRDEESMCFEPSVHVAISSCFECGFPECLGHTAQPVGPLSIGFPQHGRLLRNHGVADDIAFTRSTSSRKSEHDAVTQSLPQADRADRVVQHEKQHPYLPTGPKLPHYGSQLVSPNGDQGEIVPIVRAKPLDSVNCGYRARAADNVLDCQSILANGGKPLAASQHGHLMATAAQPICVHTADHAGAVHQDSHTSSGCRDVRGLSLIGHRQV